MKRRRPRLRQYWRRSLPLGPLVGLRAVLAGDDSGGYQEFLSDEGQRTAIQQSASRQHFGAVGMNGIETCLLIQLNK